MPDPLDVRHRMDAERRTHRVDMEIARLAGRQHGVVSRSQLAALGLGRGAIARRLEHGRLHRLDRGVYAVGHRALTRRAMWMAATLVADNAVLSHRSAAALYGIHQSDRGFIDITVPRALRARPRLDIHQATLARDEITTQHGIRITTPARTLLDLAAVLDPTWLERAATEAGIRRLASPTSLEALVARCPRREGTRVTKELLASNRIGTAITKRELELRFLAFLDTRQVSRPRINAAVHIPPEPVTVDCLWPDHRLIVELDGFETHRTRAAFEEDRARDRALVTAGYRTIRITWLQLATDAQAIESQLTTLLETNGG
jgi:very-short-patch-repair endonuclease